MDVKTFDLIVPIHLVDWRFFSSNLKSWITELNPKRIYIGCNNSNEGEFDAIKSFVGGYDVVEFIDQRNIKTLGFQIADLMKRTDGDWFYYCHSDAQLTPFCSKIMEEYMNDVHVGIIESERVQYDGRNGSKRTYHNYHYIERSFSGFQLFRKEAIENILEIIEDDYIYRNEDIIFQNVCEDNGFKYVKCWAMHIHIPTVNGNWSPKGEVLEYSEAHKITMDMQIKGIVKYCSPTPITMKAFFAAFGVCRQVNGTEMYNFLEQFIRKVDPTWERAIFNQIMVYVPK